MAKAADPGIPRYYLYGDSGADVERDFLHVEPILTRSGPHGWRIQPHAHPDHAQIFLIHKGGGTVQFEDHSVEIPLPAVMVLPAGSVHQFAFQPGTDGYVVTAALGWLNTVTASDPGLREVLAQPAVLPLRDSGLHVPTVIDTFDWLLREFVWSAPGRRIAIMALYLRLLVILLRLRIATQTEDLPPAPDRDQNLLVRYRGLIEEHFRHQRTPAFYADQLAVTVARLNAACKARAGRTASDLVHDRLMLEAKRLLLYTDHGIARIGNMIGFDDPAYFSRFFAARAGSSPASWRKTQKA